MLISSLVTTLTEQNQLTTGSSVSFMMKQVSIILQFYRDMQDQLEFKYLFTILMLKSSYTEQRDTSLVQDARE